MTQDAHQKVKVSHLKRNAYLYVRQSTLRQVLENTESTQRQYALRQHAAALGWPLDRIIVIDTDLGQSGASAADREGFQRLVTEVSLGRAGIVLGLEVSRLARNSMDWHRLLEICALADTLILDEDGVYDPAHFNDRLLLGLNRPETQSTSNSTFCWTGSFGQFRVGAQLPGPQAVPAADISDVVTRKAPAKRTETAFSGVFREHSPGAVRFTLWIVMVPERQRICSSIWPAWVIPSTWTDSITMRSSCFRSWLLVVSAPQIAGRSRDKSVIATRSSAVSLNRMAS